ncbi:YdcF family protein [Roseateles sp.]|uniref:YdcF family protein n=1 Tax=Roseateles sp. TaxID=1971397 RepID=UPI0025E0E5E8|nr:YdcF family protein [Roseateles sp.]MBV8035683.1 YdcF family protein [Roseateles sp.]
MNLALDYSGFKTLVLAVVLPPAPLLLLAAWGGWRLRRGRRFGGALLALALTGVWLSGTEAAGELLSRVVGQPALLPPSQVDALRGRQDGAVLVLGAGVRRLAPEFGGGAPTRLTAERLAYGVWLARRSGWPLGFTGGIGWTAGQLRQPEAVIVARVAAEDYRLPLRWAEASSRDTRENAAHTLPMLAAAGVKEVILVTHETHMRRALRAFEAEAAPLGLRVLPAPVGLREDALSSFDDWCPSVDGFERVRYIAYEALAWWAGR